VGALSVSAPAFRAGPEVMHDRLVPAVMAAAHDLSRRLGAAA
jgi:DNA-binding IclR family transcriptional regulator